MSGSLYLDAARLGPMSVRAQRASIAFTRLMGEEPSSSRFDQFLEAGLDALPDAMRSCFGDLADWRGIASLKTFLRLRVAASPDTPVLLASRTSQLMRLAARLLFRRARRVLLTDLEWPAYRAILEEERLRRGGELLCVPIKAAVLDGISREELAKKLLARFRERQCDGLFMSSVTFEGFALPYREVAKGLSLTGDRPFVVVDGSQAFCHAPEELREGVCDLYLAGCHKWLRAYHPMGVAFAPGASSRESVLSSCDELLATGTIDDPLLRFTGRREVGVRDRFTETVSLMPLFSCAAAVAESLEEAPDAAGRFTGLVEGARKLEEASRGSGWTPLVPHASLRTGILLLRSEDPETRVLDAEWLRGHFHESGVAVTAYQLGVIRLSAPQGEWRPDHTGVLRRVLQECGEERKVVPLTLQSAGCVIRARRHARRSVPRRARERSAYALAV